MKEVLSNIFIAALNTKENLQSRIQKPKPKIEVTFNTKLLVALF